MPQTKSPVKTPHEQPKRFIMEPPVGAPIVWYPNGTTNEKKHSAVCTEANGRGLIGIRAEAATGVVTRKRTVPHVADPRLILFKARDMEANKGAWDWVDDPAYVPAQFRDIKPAELTIIWSYQNHGKTAYEIAEMMGPPWDRKKVMDVLAGRKVLRQDDTES